MLAARAARPCASRLRLASLRSAPASAVCSPAPRLARSARPALCAPSVPRRFVSGQLPRAPKVENEEDIPFDEPWHRRVPYKPPADWINDTSLWHFYGELRYENHAAAIQALLKRGRVPGVLFGQGVPQLMLHFPISTLDLYIHRDVIGPNARFKLILPNRDCYLVNTLTTRTHPRTDKPLCISMYRETIEPVKWQGSMELPRGRRYARDAFKPKEWTFEGRFPSQPIGAK